MSGQVLPSQGEATREPLVPFSAACLPWETQLGARSLHEVTSGPLAWLGGDRPGQAVSAASLHGHVRTAQPRASSTRGPLIPKAAPGPLLPRPLPSAVRAQGPSGRHPAPPRSRLSGQGAAEPATGSGGHGHPARLCDTGLQALAAAVLGRGFAQDKAQGTWGGPGECPQQQACRCVPPGWGRPPTTAATLSAVPPRAAEQGLPGAPRAAGPPCVQRGQCPLPLPASVSLHPVRLPVPICLCARASPRCPCCLVPWP